MESLLGGPYPTETIELIIEAVEMKKTLLLGVCIDHLLLRAARRCDALRIVDYQLRDDLRNVVSAC